MTEAIQNTDDQNTPAQGKTPSVSSALNKVRILLNVSDKRTLALIGCFALAVSVLEVATASTVVLFGQALNDPEAGRDILAKIGLGQDMDADKILVFTALLVGGVYLIKSVITAAEAFFQNFSIQNMSYNFKNRLLEKYAFADYASYLMRNSSYNSRVVGGDADQVFSVAMLSIATLISESIVFICLVGLIIYINPSLALAIFCVGGLLAFGVSKFLLPHFYRWGMGARDASLMSWQNLLQFFHGFKDIVLFGKRTAFIDQYRSYARRHARLSAIQASAKAMPRIVIEILFVGMFVGVICFLAYTGQPLTSMVGTLGAYLYAGFRLMPGLNRIITHLNTFKSTIPSIERVYEEYVSVSTPENYQDVKEFEFKSDIKLTDIHFQYKGTELQALKNINLEIQKGERIGIAGQTGSGKSTLVDLILGLLKPQSGQILVDGKYPVCSRQWHAQIGYVAQSLYLTDDTIEANIAFGERPEQVDRRRLEKAVEDAQLSDLIQKLPEGLKTIAGERGVRLSGGERQRVAIARALYRGPEVLIFDEATSALDHETEKRLMETIDRVSRNHTVIMIAHRLSTLRNCDRVVKMKDGSIESIEQQVENQKQAG